MAVLHALTMVMNAPPLALSKAPRSTLPSIAMTSPPVASATARIHRANSSSSAVGVQLREHASERVVRGNAIRERDEPLQRRPHAVVLDAVIKIGETTESLPLTTRVNAGGVKFTVMRIGYVSVERFIFLVPRHSEGDCDQAAA